MSTLTHTIEETNLDAPLRTLLATHGYDKVRVRLDALAGVDAQGRRAQREREADPRYVLTLPQEEQDRILAAQVEDALPLYRADLAKPNAERELTMDLETGDFYEYHDVPERHHA